MDKLIINTLLLYLLMLFASCQKIDHTYVGSEPVEEVTSQYHDSSLTLLERMKNIDAFSRKEKVYAPHPTDSLITIATNYAMLKKTAYNQKDWKEYALLDQKYMKLCDSIAAQVEKVSIQDSQTVYDLPKTEQRLAKQQTKNPVFHLRMILMILIYLLLILLLIYTYLTHRQEKRQWILRQQQQDLRNKERLTIYEDRIRKYKEQIASKEQTLHSLKEYQKNQDLEIENLNTIHVRLKNELQLLKQKKPLHEIKVAEIAFRNSSLYVRFHDKMVWQPSLEDWQTLFNEIDLIYPTFALTLNNVLPGLTLSENRLCYLLKIQVRPAIIARLLCCSETNITMLRKRLYKKAFNKEATAKEFDKYILEI